MSYSWDKRKARLEALLQLSSSSETETRDDDDEQQFALALDRILHGQRIIGKTG